MCRWIPMWWARTTHWRWPPWCTSCGPGGSPGAEGQNRVALFQQVKAVKMLDIGFLQHIQSARVLCPSEEDPMQKPTISRTRRVLGRIANEANRLIDHC
jgi:hypothetical protein